MTSSVQACDVLRVTKRPLTDRLVTNFIASFADARALKKYLFGFLIFLALLLITASGILVARPIQGQIEKASFEAIQQFGPITAREQKGFMLEAADNPSAFQLRLAVSNAVLRGHGLEGIPSALGNQGLYLWNPESRKPGYGDAQTVLMSAGLPSPDEAATAEAVAESETSAEAESVVQAEAVSHADETSLLPSTAAETPPSQPVSAADSPAAPQAPSAKSAASDTNYVISVPNQSVMDLFLGVVAAESGPNWDKHGVMHVAQSIVNRVLNGWGTLEEVLTAPQQFDVYTTGACYTATITEAHREAVEAVLKGETVLPRSSVFFCNSWVVEGDSWWESLSKEAEYGGLYFFSP